jgi:hypothetical protein
MHPCCYPLMRIIADTHACSASSALCLNLPVPAIRRMPPQ